MDGSLPTATRAPELPVCDACQTPDRCRADEICAISGKALTEEAPPPTPEPEEEPSGPDAGTPPPMPTAEPGQRSASPRSSDPSALVTQAITAERARIAGIYDAQTKLGVERKVADDLVRQGLSLEDARARLIDQAAGKGQATATRPHITTGQQDERVTRKAAVENALLHRFDPGTTALSDAGREWRGLSLLEMGRAFLDTEGVRTRGMSRDQVAARALHSTSDFPHILAAVANKTLRKAYEAAPRTFMPFCRQVSASDFKDMHRVQLGEAPSLEKVLENGVFKRGTIGEGKESYRVETFGKIFAISRQVIINDDLDAFTRVPNVLGLPLRYLRPECSARPPPIWKATRSGASSSPTPRWPTMSDYYCSTASLLENGFHAATHKNLATAGTALAVEGVGKGRSTMAAQKGLDGKEFFVCATAPLLERGPKHPPVIPDRARGDCPQAAKR